MIALFDIDGTLSNAAWRDNLMNEEDWDSYHAAAERDEPHARCVHLLNAWRAGNNLAVGLTTRPEKWRQLTMGWLLRHSVFLDDLIMRPNEDYRPSAIVKVGQVTQKWMDLSDIAFILDDNENVIAAFKAIGIPALHGHWV